MSVIDNSEGLAFFSQLLDKYLVSTDFNPIIGTNNEKSLVTNAPILISTDLCLLLEEASTDKNIPLITDK